MNQKKMVLSLLLCVAMVLGLFPGAALAVVPFAGGTGTPEDPYQINTAEQLQQLAEYLQDSGNTSYNAKCYKLTADLDLSGIANWLPIGTGTPFAGAFDGGDHVIRNLKVDSYESNVGLFGETSNAVIQNLGLENVSVMGGQVNVGGLVGCADSTTIERCYVTGAVTGNYGVGGIVGSNGGSATKLRNCYAKVTLAGNTARGDVSGLVGWGRGSDKILAENCYSACTGELRPIIGWSDGFSVKNEQLSGCWFDAGLSPAYWKTIESDPLKDNGNREALAKTSEELKTRETYTEWDFTSVWDIDSTKNNGYPFLRFAPASDTPATGFTVKVTVEDQNGNRITNANVELREEIGSPTTLSHAGNGVYSQTLTLPATPTSYAIWVNSADTGKTITCPTTPGTAEETVTITVTPTLPEPPSGYIGNGIMAYKVDETTNNIDVKGYYNGSWISTSYSDSGYPIATEGLDGATVEAGAEFVNGGKYVKLFYTVTAGDEAITGGKLGISSDTKVGSADASTLNAIKDSRGRTIGLVMLNDVSDSASEGAQFNLYFANAAHVNPDCSTYWFGAYPQHDDNVFNPLDSSTAYASDGTYGDDYSSYGGDDSALAFSWQDINLAVHEAKTFSVVVGIGEAATPPEFICDVTADSDPTNKKITAATTVKDKTGETDTLYYSVAGGQETALGSVVADGTDKTISKDIDLSGYQPGTYRFEFWVVNTSGAASAKISRDIVITVDGVTVEIPKDYFNISASASPAEGGMVAGAGRYEEGTLVTLTATANTGYTFKEWTENGDSVSTLASYAFEVTGARMLVAVFEQGSGGTGTPNPQPSAPIIILPVQPQTVRAAEGSTGSLSVTAVGDQPLFYQWQIDRGDGKDFVDIPGATGASYITSPVNGNNNGYRYRCVVSNLAGRAISPIFTLEVFADVDIPQTGDADMGAAYVVAMALCAAIAAGVILGKRQYNR